MARLAPPVHGQHSGLYEWLRQREEQRMARWAHNDGSSFRYPKYRIDALRAGEPVSVPGWMLPRAVRESTEYLSHDRRIYPDGTQVWTSQTATVHPNGRVEYRPQTAEEWMVEHGMLHDENRHPNWREYQRSLDPED